MNGDIDGLNEEDMDEADRFVDELADDGLRLVAPIDGTENEFNSYPAFGKATSTVNWSTEAI